MKSNLIGVCLCVYLIAILKIGVSFSVVREFSNSKVNIENDNVEIVSNADEISFMVVGDFGGLPFYPYKTFTTHRISKQMAKLAKEYNTTFQLSLGDNFYFHGVKDENDTRFRNSFEDVFNSEELKNTPWFFILGNHDHYGNAQAQIYYTFKSNRWILPSLRYTINVKTNMGKRNLIDFLMIDTIILCGNSDKDDALIDIEPKYQTKHDKQMADEYFSQVEIKIKEISESKVPYLIVSGHFPIWSIGKHGPTKCLIDKLRPLLHKYDVSAYFCGHDHSLQHISDTFEGSKVEYFVSGAGNFIENSLKNKNKIPTNSLKFNYRSWNFVYSGGFAFVKANEHNMTLSFISASGEKLYSTTIFPRI